MYRICNHIVLHILYFRILSFKYDINNAYLKKNNIYLNKSILNIALYSFISVIYI